MTLIDYTYFQRRLLAIPNLQDATLEQLNDYIPVLESRYLDIMLGKVLKLEFLTGLEQPIVEQRWTDLQAFFVNADKLSPIANYIFCTVTNNNQLMNTGVGEVKKMAENSMIVTPQYRVSAVWNDAVEMNKDIYEFLNTDDYPTWEPQLKPLKSLLSYDYNIGL